MFGSTRFKQFFVIGTVFTIASLDLLKPGYLTFANPIDLLPFNAPGMIQSLTRCNDKKSISLDFIPTIANLVKTRSDIDSLRRVLGREVCVTGGDRVYVFDLKPYLMQDLQLRVRIDDKGYVTNYELLR